MFKLKNLLLKILEKISHSNRQKLLWQNPSPSSSMAATTITSLSLLDLPQYYNTFLVVFDWNHANYTDARFGVLGKIIRCQSAYNTSTSSSLLIKSRDVTINNDNIVIGDCYSKSTSATSTRSTTNQYLVPYKIYGIKGEGI